MTGGPSLEAAAAATLCAFAPFADCSKRVPRKKNKSQKIRQGTTAKGNEIYEIIR